MMTFNLILGWVKQYIYIPIFIIILLSAIHFFSPLKIFKGLIGTKTEIKDTSLDIKEINEIGELIASEYHGEVVNSLTGVYIESNTNDIKLAYRTYRSIYKSLNTKKEKRKYIKNIKKDKEFIFLKNLTKYNSWAIKTDKNKKFMDRIVSNFSAEDFYKEHENQIKKILADQKGKPEIIYLGRGIVTAGYKLHNLEKNQFKFSDNHDSLLIVNLDPEILDFDINPYYKVPDDKDKDISDYFGFEILRITKPNQLRFDKVLKVKEGCRQMLRKEAIKRRILERADKKGEETLRALFTLWGSQTEYVATFKYLKVVNTRYFNLKQGFLEDLRISGQELDSLEKLIKYDSTHIDKLRYDNLSGQNDAMEDFIKELYQETLSADNTEEWWDFYNTRFSVDKYDSELVN